VRIPHGPQGQIHPRIEQHFPIVQLCAV